MQSIKCLKDIQNLVNKLPEEFLEYLTWEFNIFYESFSSGEGIEKFNLDSHQAINIVEEFTELELILEDKFNLDYVDEIELESMICLRIGVHVLEDVQLYYFIKNS